MKTILHFPYQSGGYAGVVIERAVTDHAQKLIKQAADSPLSEDWDQFVAEDARMSYTLALAVASAWRRTI